MSASPIYQKEQRHRTGMERQVWRLHLYNGVAMTIIVGITALVVIGLLAILGYLLVQGVPYLLNPDFYGTKGEETIGKQLFNTFYILIFAEIILIPIALAAAIYLVEYARQGFFVGAVRFAAETLAGVPSIVIGLFGYLVFCSIFGWRYSRMAAALALLCLNLPIALRLFEDALTSVPRDLREAGLALGATRWRVIRTVVLPSAIPGMVTAIVLTMGKIIAESAVLAFTMGTSSPRNVLKLDPFTRGDTLTVRIWYVKTIGADSLDANVVDSVAAGSAALLLIILLLINVLARMIGRRVQRRFTAT